MNTWQTISCCNDHHDPGLNRLIATRHLIDNSGQELTPFSDPLAVAQKILIAHDAAELTLSALRSHLNLANESQFMPTARAVSHRAYPENENVAGAAIDLFNHLNDLRVAFKHRGNLPDVSSTYFVYFQIVETLDSMCDHLLGMPLTQIDHSAAIRKETVRDRLFSARNLIERTEYRNALEEISLALYDAFWDLDLPSHIIPGEASSEHALLLSGRGVDPASFITMQKFLPVTSNGQEIRWTLRGTGHDGNWTAEVAEFCLRTAIMTIVRLQSAPLLPTPIDFYNHYEDVVEIIVDHPEIFRGSLGIADVSPQPIHTFNRGDRIRGRAMGYWEIGTGYDESTDFDLEHAPLIALRNPIHSSIDSQGTGLYRRDVLWVKRSEVILTYQSNGWRETLQRQAERQAVLEEIE